VHRSFIFSSEMNGRSSENNVAIKSGQQVCVVFLFMLFSYSFLFFISLDVHFAMTEKEKGCKGDDLVRPVNEMWRGLGGVGGMRGHGVSHVSIFQKDKSKTLPMLTFEVFTLLRNACPFPS